jgi:hypothetical protein
LGDPGADRVRSHSGQEYFPSLEYRGRATWRRSTMS